MTEVFHIAARVAFETSPQAAEAKGDVLQGLPFGLHAILITMICAALGAMVLKRRLPWVSLTACLSVLIALGTVLAAYQTGQKEIAIGGFCVIVGIYMIDYFSRVMNSLEHDLGHDHATDGSDQNSDGAPSRG